VTRRHIVVSILAAAAVALAVAAARVASTGAEDAAANRPAPAAPAPPIAPSTGAGASLEALQARIIEISDRVTPSVAHVEAIVRVNDRRSEVTGSGVLASADGRILTNHHVVEKAEKVTVVVPGHVGRIPARVVGTDKQTDLALLRIEPPHPLAAASFGRSEDVRVGQWVLAVGNPYGLEGTVSLGIVSAKGRNLGIPDLINDFIQTDAMIDRGSSGGPLVDLEGRVIGINSRGQGRGIGFTIPIDTALEVMRKLEAGGVERGWLGVAIQPLDRELATYFGIAQETGVVVNSVTPRSPAAKAGLEPGDILTRFDGQRIEAEKEEDLGSFQRLVAAVAPGHAAALELLRGGARRTVEVTLTAAPRVESDEVESDVGFLAQEITETLYRNQRLGTRKGAYVSFVASGSPAAEAGLFVGDVIRRIERRDVATLDDLRAALADAQALPRFLVTTERGDERRFLLVRREAKPVEPGAKDAAGEAASRTPP
jgi:serine protease Do